MTAEGSGGDADHAELSPGVRAAVEWLAANAPEIQSLPRSGRGETIQRWRWLARLGATDLVLAQLAERYADAVAVLRELGRLDLLEGLGTCGVWHDEPHELKAVHSREGWHLAGHKRWCAGSILLDRALVTAMSPDGPRLFLVDIAGSEGISIVPGSWAAVGMADTAAHTLRFDVTVPHHRGVGAHDAYAGRPGFGHRRAGIAAVWFGGAVAVSETLRRAVGALRAADADPARPHLATTLAEPADPEGLAMAYGRVRAELDAAAATLREAAHTIDHYPGNLALSIRTAAQTRTVVEAAARTTMEQVGVALGASPLTHDAEHAKRVADLSVYLRRHHTVRERRFLGLGLTEDPPQL